MISQNMEGKYRVLIYFEWGMDVDRAFDCPLEAIAELNSLYNQGYNVRLERVGERDEVEV